MSMRTVTLLCGVVGGVAWLARWVLDLIGSGGAAGDLLYWAGLVLLAVALAGFGAGLVSASATWLRAIVAVAFPLLVWSVLEVTDPGTDVALLDALLGLIVVVTAGMALRPGPERPAASTHHRGAHAR